MVDRFERFSYAISEISRCWHKLAAEEMAKYSLKGPHAVYLVTMRRYSDGITAAQLCDVCGRDKADVSRAVSMMEEKGLISRQGVNRNHYRALLKLTAEGAAAADHVCLRVSIAVELAGKGFSDDHREIFYNVLEKITANLKTLSKEGLPQSCT